MFAILLIGFTVVWLGLAIRGTVREFKSGQANNWLIVAFGALTVLGAGGFFACMLSAEGILKLAKHREWPAGYVEGIAKTSQGEYIVPLVPSGRIQLYDSQWHFLRGWNVDAEGGEFTVHSAPDHDIEVFHGAWAPSLPVLVERRLVALGNGPGVILPTRCSRIGDERANLDFALGVLESIQLVGFDGNWVHRAGNCNQPEEKKSDRREQLRTDRNQSAAELRLGGSFRFSLSSAVLPT